LHFVLWTDKIWKSKKKKNRTETIREMRPFSLLIKPAGPDCNLACRYCFYACKSGLFGQGRHRMSEATAETMVRDYLGLGLEISIFAWQGGEPTLMGLDFFEKIIGLQKQYGRGGQLVSNALQTNAILLDDRWCEFLAQNQILVGISLDGPAEIHDYYRKDHSGRGSFDRVMNAIECCRKHRVEFNILVLIHDRNADRADELFDFFTAQKFGFLQLIPCAEIDPSTGQMADYSIDGLRYGRFLCRMFERWLDYGPTRLSIRLFDSILSYALGRGQTECTLSPQCDDYIVIEHDGQAFCCDFFVDPEYRLGNIHDMPIGQLAGSPRKRDFAEAKRQIANKCLVCRYLDVCRGGCPKDRLIRGKGITAESWFCEGYKMLFDRALGHLRGMAARLNKESGYRR
jgi:uncharacterized protein